MAEEILTYIKSPRNGSVCYFSSKLDVPSNVVQKKRVARILFFKIRQSQEILKIRDGTPLEAEEILTYIKCPRNGSVCYFYSKLDVSSNVVQKKKVARILFFKIRSSQGILEIRDGSPMEKKRVARILFFKIWSSQGILKVRDYTPMEAEEILTYIKRPRNGSVCYFSSKLDVSSNVVQKKKVARILGILKVRDCTLMEAEEILTYIKSPRNGSVCYFSSKLDVPSNVVQKKREILTYIKSPRNGSVCYFSSKLDVPSNVVQNKRVARILFYKIRPSQEILKIRDGTPLEAEEILTYIKSPRNGSVCYFSSKLDVPSNVVQKKRVARILFFKIKSSQGILKIRDGTPMELDVPSNVVQKKRVAQILFFKIWSSQGILEVRDCTPMEAEEILTYIKRPRNGSVCYFSSKLDVSSNVVQKKKVARILVARILLFKIWSSQGILKVRDCTPMEAEEILTYIKSPRNGSVCYFSSKLDVPKILKIRDGTFGGGGNFDIHKMPSKRIGLSSQGILEIRDGSPMELDVPSNVVQKKRVARILFFKIWSSQGILKVRDYTPMEAEEILTYIKRPRNGSVCYFSSKLDLSSNVVQKKKVARILFYKIRPSQEI
ncbi:hypothetical protein OROMI_024911 [Orobanche minor]